MSNIDLSQDRPEVGIRPPLVPRINFLMAMAMASVLLGYVIFELISWPIFFYVSCAFLVFICGFHAMSGLLRGTLNAGSTIISQSMLWYSIPFSYIGFFDYDSYIPEYPQLQNAQSVALVVGISIIPYFFFEKYKFLISLPKISFDWISYAIFMIPVLVIQIYYIGIGGRGYAKMISESEGGLSIIYQFVDAFSPAIMPICSISIAQIISFSSERRRVLPILFNILAVAVQMIWWATGGRRYMAVILIISVTTFLMVYLKGRFTRRRALALIATVFIIVPTVWQLWEAYYLLRVATNETMGSENLSVLDLQRARMLAGSDFQGAFQENAVTRPFATVTSLTAIRETATGYLWGWNAGSQLLLSIPSMFFTDKFGVIGPTSEYLWAEKIGVPFNDWTNTIFLEGYIDLGPIGFILYTIIIVSLVKISEKMGLASKSNPLQVFIYFNIAFMLLNAETTMNTIFVSVRTIAFVLLATLIFSQLRHQNRRPLLSLS